MPTRHTRVSVVRDPELRDALKITEESLDGRSEAARLRELALIGARSLGALDAELAHARAALDQLGATRERGDLLAISSRFRGRDHGDESVSDSLEWARGQR